MPPDSLGILLISGGHERAHYAFVLAAGAAAMGRAVVVFATNEGCRALVPDPGWDAEEAAVKRKGVATLHTLRDAATELGVRLLACDSGLLLAGLDPTGLLADVEVAGVPTFLSAVGPGAIVTL